MGKWHAHVCLQLYTSEEHQQPALASFRVRPCTASSRCMFQDWQTHGCGDTKLSSSFISLMGNSLLTTTEVRCLLIIPQCLKKGGITDGPGKGTVKTERKLEPFISPPSDSMGSHCWLWWEEHPLLTCILAYPEHPLFPGHAETCLVATWQFLYYEKRRTTKL